MVTSQKFINASVFLADIFLYQLLVSHINLLYVTLLCGIADVLERIDLLGSVALAWGGGGGGVTDPDFCMYAPPDKKRISKKGGILERRICTHLIFHNHKYTHVCYISQFK